MTSRPRYVHHVTLTTGDVRYSPRDEVRDDIVAGLRPLIGRALTGKHTPVPTPDGAGFTLTGGVLRDCCAITLWAPDPSMDATPSHVPVLTVGVAPHGRCGARLWRMLHEGATTLVRTSPDERPPAPWCADRIEVGAALYPDAMHWTGDLSRCLAWAWIEMREGGGGHPP